MKNREDGAKRVPAFDGFISYSRSDREFTANLQLILERRFRALEKSARSGRQRLRLFRDETDLRSRDELTDQIKSALEGSTALIVVCSPAAAKSTWVAKEIAFFREASGPKWRERVVTLLREGSDSALDESFPAELVDHEGQKIWLEFRESKMGRAADYSRFLREEGTLRVLAALLNTSYRDLANRQNAFERLQFRRRIVAATSVAIVLLVVALIAAFEWSRAEAAAHVASLRLVALAREQGRQAVVEREPMRAAGALLSVPASDAVDEPFRFLLGEAMRPRDALVAPLEGHVKGVTQACFGPSDALAMTVSLDGTARIWNAKDGVQICVMDAKDPSHQFGITGGEIGKSGIRALTWGTDGTAMAWEIPGGRRITVIGDSEGGIAQCWWAHFLDSDRKVVTLRTTVHGRKPEDPDSFVVPTLLEIWDVAESRRLSVVGDATGASQFAVSPDERWLATTGATSSTSDVVAEDPRVVVWDLLSCTAVASVSRPSGNTLEFGWLDRQLYWIGGQGASRHTTLLRIPFPPDDQRAPGGFTTDHPDPASTATIGRSTGMLCLGDSNGRLAAYSRGGEALVARYAHSQGITRLAVSPSEDWIASGSADGAVRLWDAHDGAWIASLLGRGQPVTVVKFDAAGDRLLVADRTGKAWLFRIEWPLVPQRVLAHGGAVTSLRFDSTGDLLASAGSDGIVQLHPASHVTSSETVARHEGSVTSLVFGRGGRLLHAGIDGVAGVWVCANSREQSSLRTPGEMINSACLDAAAEWILTASCERLADPEAERRVAAGTPASSRDAPSDAVTPSPSRAGRAILWNALTGARVRVFEGAAARGPMSGAVGLTEDDLITWAVFLGRGEKVLTKGKNGPLCLWSSTDDSLYAARDSMNLEGPLRESSISPDGRCLASAERVVGLTTIQTWDGGLKPKERIDLPELDGVSWMGIAPSGRLLATALRSGGVRLWKLDPLIMSEKLDTGPSAVSCCEFRPGNSDLLTTGDAEGEIRIWDAASATLLDWREGGGSAVCALAWSRDGERLACGFADGHIDVWCFPIEAGARFRLEEPAASPRNR